MIDAALSAEADFDAFRALARRLYAAGVPPDGVVWSTPSSPASLFASHPAPDGPGAQLTAPKSFIDDARRAACLRETGRYDRLYRLLWRLQSDRWLMQAKADPDLVWLREASKAVSRDVHKMKAFVRFRRLPSSGPREAYAAWFEPAHYIVDYTAPFFMRRFAGMDWSILTPERSVRWNGETLIFGPGAEKTDAPAFDAVEDQWTAYFESIFNPARVKIDAMCAEMPKKYWKNLPEAKAIPRLLLGADARVATMREDGVTAPNIRARRKRK